MSKHKEPVKIARAWFRFYATSVDDPKVQKLPAHLFKTWVNLLCLASGNGGIIPCLGDVSFRLRMSDHDAQCQIDELIGLALIDIRPDRALEPHNWNVRQYVSDVSNERVSKFRENKKKTPCNVTVTLHETPPDTEAESDTDQNPPLAPPSGGGRSASKFFHRKRRRMTVADVLANREKADAS